MNCRYATILTFAALAGCSAPDISSSAPHSSSVSNVLGDAEDGSDTDERAIIINHEEVPPMEYPSEVGGLGGALGTGGITGQPDGGGGTNTGGEPPETEPPSGGSPPEPDEETVIWSAHYSGDVVAVPNEKWYAARLYLDGERCPLFAGLFTPGETVTKSFSAEWCSDESGEAVAQFGPMLSSYDPIPEYGDDCFFRFSLHAFEADEWPPMSGSNASFVSFTWELIRNP